MKIAPTQRIQAAPNVLYQELDGESVLLNLGNEQYYGLDQVGTRMWSLLTTAPSLAEAKQTLLAEYEVDSVQLDDDLQQLLAELLAQGLVTVAA